MEIVGHGDFFVREIRMNMFGVLKYIQSCNMSGTFVPLQVEAAHNGQLKDALDGFNKARIGEFQKLMSSEMGKKCYGKSPFFSEESHRFPWAVASIAILNC